MVTCVSVLAWAWLLDWLLEAWLSLELFGAWDWLAEDWFSFEDLGACDWLLEGTDELFEDDDWAWLLLELGAEDFLLLGVLEDSVFEPEDSLTLALGLLVLPLSFLDDLTLLDEVTWLLLGVLAAELDSLWLEQAVSKAIEERVTIESTITWENLFFIIISSFLVFRKK